MFIKNAINSSHLNWIDNLSDGVNTKIMAMIPGVSTIVSVFRHVRFNHLIEKNNMPLQQEAEAYDNFEKFTVTIHNWGRIQVITGAVATLAFAGLGLALGGAGAAAAFVVAGGMLIFASLTALSHKISHLNFSSAPFRQKLMEQMHPQV